MSNKFETSFTFAVGDEIAVILDGDDWIKEELKVSYNMDELGIDFPEQYGIYRWKGEVEMVYDEVLDQVLPEYQGEYELIFDFDIFDFERGKE